MSNYNNRTQKEIVLNFLSRGNNLTVAQAKKSFRIGNPYEVIRRLRADGNAIYLNNKNGKNHYALASAPSRNAVRLTYRRLGARAFR